MVDGIQVEKCLNSSIAQEPEENSQQDTQSTLIRIPDHFHKAFPHAWCLLAQGEFLGFLDECKDKQPCHNHQHRPHPKWIRRVKLIQTGTPHEGQKSSN